MATTDTLTPSLVTYNANRERLVIAQHSGEILAGDLSPDDINLVFFVCSSNWSDGMTMVEVRPTVEDVVEYLKIDLDFAGWVARRREQQKRQR